MPSLTTILLVAASALLRPSLAALSDTDYCSLNTYNLTCFSVNATFDDLAPSTPPAYYLAAHWQNFTTSPPPSTLSDLPASLAGEPIPYFKHIIPATPPLYAIAPSGRAALAFAPVPSPKDPFSATGTLRRFSFACALPDASLLPGFPVACDLTVTATCVGEYAGVGKRYGTVEYVGEFGYRGGEGEMYGVSFDVATEGVGKGLGAFAQYCFNYTFVATGELGAEVMLAVDEVGYAITTG